MNEKKMTVNPMWVLFLGACPALGATGTLKGAVAMGVTVLAVMLLTALVMALLPHGGAVHLRRAARAARGAAVRL